MRRKAARSFPLRLEPSVHSRVAATARDEGLSLTQFISLALAEKISRTHHERWLGDQAARPVPEATSPSLTLLQLRSSFGRK